MAKTILRLEAGIVLPGNFQLCYFHKGRQVIDYLELLKNEHVLERKALLPINKPVPMGKIDHITLEMHREARTYLHYVPFESKDNSLKTLEVDVFSGRGEMIDFLRNPIPQEFRSPIKVYIPARYHITI